MKNKLSKRNEKPAFWVAAFNGRFSSVIINRYINYVLVCLGIAIVLLSANVSLWIVHYQLKRQYDGLMYQYEVKSLEVSDLKRKLSEQKLIK